MTESVRRHRRHRRLRRARHGVAFVAAVLAAAFVGCTRERSQPERPRRVAHTRDVTITTVPFITRELESTYGFIKPDLAPGGVLAGKEVYGFAPSAVTAVEGDTIRFTLVNPEDDPHTFVVEGASAALPPQTTVHLTYVARHPGIFDFRCVVPSHAPMMHGELVVLAASAVAE